MVYSERPSIPCVLFVDPDRSARTFVKRALESEGYEVLTANNSIEALALAADFPGTIDLLLANGGKMPFQNGPQLAECFKLMRPETSVVLTSAAKTGAATLRNLLTKSFSKKLLLEIAELSCLAEAA